MPRFVLIYLAMLAAVASFSSGDVFGATSEAQANAQSFLNKAAEEHQIEISLGQLAAQRATNERVKEFGQQMVDDHKKAGQQVEQLAMKDGVQLSAGVNQEHKQRVNELSQLAGHAFDRAYMNYILQNHETTVEEFQREAKTVQDQDIKQWIISIVPFLEAHREKARQVKYSLQTNP
ncbi:MAG: DUF4142 domain-containing protein [Nitrospira sp. BO4]|jgi:putative membrane protein|nr:DUF4142 domain-containing protein [Nitrospira sp. BO4]